MIYAIVCIFLGIINFAKYSSLFTFSSEIPINRAFPEVKSWFSSSPLFTSLHPSPLLTGITTKYVA